MVISPRPFESSKLQSKAAVNLAVLTQRRDRFSDPAVLAI
jgi:hypothetical protein